MRQFILIFLALWASGTSAQTNVAFSAVKTNDQLDGSVDDPVTFDRIDVDIPSFDGTTFTVPVQGLYLFTFTGFSEEMTLHLKVNGVIRRSAEIDLLSYGTHEENVASNSVILALNVGDEVGIFLSYYCYGLYNTHENGFFTQFSGVLLYQSTDEVTAFSAAKLDDQLSDSIDRQVTYDVIDTNLGGAFDGTTFTAPHSGLYLFTFAGRGDHFLVELKINGNTRRSIIYDYEVYSSSYYDSAFSNFMMLILNGGDTVVTSLSANYGDLRNADLDRNIEGLLTEFSGVLLNETSAPSSDNQGQQMVNDVVAFSATKNIDQVVSSETLVTFDKVDCNIGSGYDGESTFTAPVQGTYLFTFSFTSEDSMVHLKVNGLIKRSARRLTSYYTYNTQLATNSAILSLNQGDVVQLFLLPGEIERPELAAGAGYTHFSGVLLFEN